MRESPTVNEWRAEGRVENKQQDIIELYELRFHHAAPAEFADAVNGETDLDRLDRWFRAAATANTAEEFLAQVELEPAR